LQYYYIGYESRGGVDVIPRTTDFEKRVFRDFKLKVPFFAIFFRGNFGNFGKPSVETGVNFTFFFGRFSLLKNARFKTPCAKVGQFFQKRSFLTLFFRKFPGFSGIRGISRGKISRKSGNFPAEFSPEIFQK